MSDGGESCEELLNLLHQRLVATGEWNTLLAQLRQLLEESEWDTQLREQAERTPHTLTQARHARKIHCTCLRSSPSLDRTRKVGAKPHPETLPNSVRDTMSAKIRDFLDRNLEDA
ncbi:hypothetical protein CBS9595_003287 [Malassezia furfur]|nr:hypothetical protein CBS9595_003287 [Malassezia furfur]